MGTLPPRYRSALDGAPRDESLVAEVSHELRGRMTAVLTAVSLLGQYRRHLPPEGQQVLTLLTEETAHFERLLVELLDMAREDVEPGRDRAVGTVPICPVVAAVLGRHTGGRPAEELLHVGDGAHDLLVRADRRHLERAVENLLTNAEHHGGGVVAVRIEHADATVRVHVDDAGPGVPEEDRPRVFERFVRGTDSDGSGLGLALADRWVRTMGGRLSVGDSPAGGARFTVVLPVVRRVVPRRPPAPDVDRPPAGG